MAAVEGVTGASLDGFVQPYASYVNRVYALRADDGTFLIAKFYRPGRWSIDTIRAEHRFLLQLEDAEVPVVAPLADEDGDTLFELELELNRPEDDRNGGSLEVVPFALFPRRGGRGFDAERDQDWYRLGSVVGRIHAVGRREDAPQRRELGPDWAHRYLDHLDNEGVVHPEVAPQFFDLARQTIDRIAPRFAGCVTQRIHGDCHRGNILDRPGEGLIVIDFDDMMVGPAVQDLWLLLPDHAESCRRELTMLLDGYEEFTPFDRRELALIEPLRLMRMIHFLSWRADQRHDHWFRRDQPDWGDRGFWVKELEDLREQVRIIDGEG